MKLMNSEREMHTYVVVDRVQDVVGAVRGSCAPSGVPAALEPLEYLIGSAHVRANGEIDVHLDLTPLSGRFVLKPMEGD
jgi:hypothetical protein